jgi:hypothetical protein
MAPRLATEKEAAEAIGLDLATFRTWVSSARLRVLNKSLKASRELVQNA